MSIITSMYLEGFNKAKKEVEISINIMNKMIIGKNFLFTCLLEYRLHLFISINPASFIFLEEELIMEIAKPYGILFLLKILQVNVLLSKKEN